MNLNNTEQHVDNAYALLTQIRTWMAVGHAWTDQVDEWARQAQAELNSARTEPRTGDAESLVDRAVAAHCANRPATDQQLEVQVNAIIRAAAANMGDDLAGGSPLDLVADQLPQYPLPALKSALVTCGLVQCNPNGVPRTARYPGISARVASAILSYHPGREVAHG
jgi:lysozyme family protein